MISLLRSVPAALPAVVSACGWAVFPAVCQAQDTGARPEPGHSVHGESFSEGPRRRGQLMQGMGAVHFPVTTASAEAQRWFDQGVGQLHGFWYWEAERSFRTVLELDPGCVMAHWGLAMANLENEERARGFAGKADRAALEKITPRERAWIQAVQEYLEPAEKGRQRDGKAAARRFLSRLEDLALDFPEDIEARAFVVGLQWGKRSQLGLEPVSHFGMDAIARSVLRENPRHPVHHYVIHLWDGDKNVRALGAAEHCGPAAPGIAHMWHMPSHIYSGLDRWAEAAWQQEAAARVDHAQMIRSHTMPDQIHNFAHNSEWLVRNLNNLGRVEDALTVSMNLIELPRIPRSPRVSEVPDQKLDGAGRRSAWEDGTTRLRDTLLSWEHWELALRLGETPWLEETTEDFPHRWRRLQLLGIAAFRTQRRERGAEFLKQFEELVESVRKERAAAVDAADRKARDEGKEGKQVQEAMGAALQTFTPRLDTLEPALAELRVLADLAAGDRTAARARLGALKGIHDQRLAAIRLELADYDKAAELASNYAARSDHQVQPQALLVRTLWRAGRQEEALVEFATLRKLAGTADLSAPLLADLGPVARAAEAPEDWRLPAEADQGGEAPPEVLAAVETRTGDVMGEEEKDCGAGQACGGEKDPESSPPAAVPPSRTEPGPVFTEAEKRPPLESLGPLRWEGWMAPEWTAAAPDGSTQGHAALRGRPYIALLVLGGSCTHCNEQLAAFSKKVETFTKAGLPLVAVTTDAPEKLSGTPAGFPVWSGHGGTAFKALDAWDDFEDQPLHTTVLVDATGRIRWQHSGYEPFMKPEFLLEEAQRLLRLDALLPEVRIMAGLAAPSRVPPQKS